MDIYSVKSSRLHFTQPQIMNKIISTNDRVFMAVVGPSGSGKTQLIFNMLLRGTFQARFSKVVFCYKDFQPQFPLMKKKLSIQFLRFQNFDFLADLEDCLLIFDDSCEEIYSDKTFVKLATAGRHKNIDTIYVKHNLFQQSRWSRTIDLNTTHIILFKSPRDVQQVDYLGRQLNLAKFLRHCYQLSTKEAFGHFLIDLNPKTSETLRFCSNITGPGPSIFYPPAPQPDEIPLSNERDKSLYAKTFESVNKVTAEENFEIET